MVICDLKKNKHFWYFFFFYVLFCLLLFFHYFPFMCTFSLPCPRDWPIDVFSYWFVAGSKSFSLYRELWAPSESWARSSAPLTLTLLISTIRRTFFFHKHLVGSEVTINPVQFLQCPCVDENMSYIYLALVSQRHHLKRFSIDYYIVCIFRWLLSNWIPSLKKKKIRVCNILTAAFAALFANFPLNRSLFYGKAFRGQSKSRLEIHLYKRTWNQKMPKWMNVVKGRIEIGLQ